MNLATSINRAGKFTSSEIWKLCTMNKSKDGFGAPGITYIKEKAYERRLHRSLKTEQNSRETAWGHLVEQYLFSLLEMKYDYNSDLTIQHPLYEYWAGSPDFQYADTVGDGKCPFTLKSFCEQVEACMEGVQAFKELKPEYYWQLVSNAILTDSKFIEIILFVPNLEQLYEIQALASKQEVDPHKYLFIYHAFENELPYLVGDGLYKPLNIFKFEPIHGDREFLIQRVQMAEELIQEL